MRNLTVSEINEHYAKLLTNVDFDRLDLILKKPNIFNALKIAHYEIRHSNFLAWLINPQGNHGLSDLFLKRVLIDIISDDRAEDLNVVDITKLLKQNLNVHREWSNIDVLLDFDDAVIAIENKIGSGEHSNQLEKYFKIVDEHFPNKKRVFCYLTPFGVESSMTNKYVELGYSRIVSHLEDIYSLYQSSLNAKVKIYIQDYIENLKLNIMEDSEANELARDIYINHKELFDFIYENKPDEATDFLKIIKTYFEKKGFKIGSPNKGYIRFIKPELYDILKPYDKNFGGWTNREPLLFEIDFLWTKNKFVFKVTISPSEYKLKDTLKDILRNVDCSIKPKGEKWFVFYTKHMERKSLTTILEKDINEIESYLEKAFKDIFPIVSKYEEAIWDNKERIRASIDY